MSPSPDLDQLVAHMRADLLVAPEGAVWLCHLNAAGVPCLRTPVPELAEATDELYLRDLEARVLGLGLPGVALVIRRADGRPRPVDRRLVRELSARLSAVGSPLVGAVVVGDDDSRPVPVAVADPSRSARALARPRQ
jgi:hypothetical protein